jgi:signal transduction histidine kinase
VLNSVNRALSSRELAHAALASVLEVSACASGSIWLRDQEDVRCVAQFPPRPNNQAPQPSPALSVVLANGQPAWLAPANAQEGQADALVPLIARGALIGALHIAGARNELARPLVLACADVIAGALQQAQLAEQLDGRRSELQSMKRQHDELISIISHDLKNPMASIKGYADLLLRRSTRTPDDPNRRGLQVISEQVTRMGEMLDALLDVSRMSSSRLSFEPHQADLAPVVRELVAGLQESAGDHELRLDGAEHTYHCIFDTRRIRQAIEQLVRNAIRFSPAGQPVELTLQRSGAAAVLVVRDHGIGIPAEQRERIFEPFFRANNASGQAGLGLGLFIAQQIVKRHAGQIWCEADEGQGASFFLSLPLAPA